MLWAVWGWVAAGVGMASGLPQIIRLVSRGTSAGVSTRLWQLNLAAFMAWTVHGFVVGYIQMQLPNAFLVVCSFLVLRMIATDRNEALLHKLVIPLVIFAALLVVDLLLDPAVFGVAVAISPSAGLLAQLRDMIKATDLSGVSPAYLALGLTVQLLWWVWSIPMREASIFACSGMVGSLCLVNLSYLAFRRRVRIAP